MASTNTIEFTDGRKRFVGLVQQGLRDRGFAHIRELSFGRGSPKALELLSFGARRGREGEFCSTFAVGVRFPEVEALLRPDEADDLVATVAKPLSVLKPGQASPDSCFDGHLTPTDIVRNVLADIDDYGIPFLTLYSSIAEVMHSLQSDDPRHWFVLDPEQRLMTLSAMEYVQGRPTEALQRLASAIATLKEAPSKKRRPLEQLHARLVTTTG